MKNLELQAIAGLVSVYEELYALGATEDVVMKAKSIYDQLHPGQTILGEITNSAVGKLFPIAYIGINPKSKTPTHAEIGTIIESLKKRLHELEKEK